MEWFSPCLQLHAVAAQVIFPLQPVAGEATSSGYHSIYYVGAHVYSSSAPQPFGETNLETSVVNVFLSEGCALNAWNSV